VEDINDQFGLGQNKKVRTFQGSSQIRMEVSNWFLSRFPFVVEAADPVCQVPACQALPEGGGGTQPQDTPGPG
jgi:hypothetical protein